MLVSNNISAPRAGIYAKKIQRSAQTLPRFYYPYFQITRLPPAFQITRLPSTVFRATNFAARAYGIRFYRPTPIRQLLSTSFTNNAFTVCVYEGAALLPRAPTALFICNAFRRPRFVAPLSPTAFSENVFNLSRFRRFSPHP